MNRKGEHVSIPQGGLVKNARAWYHFLVTRLMLAQHISDVIRNRAILLYDIVTHNNFDVGRMIEKKMRMSVQSEALGLYIPSMITALCA